MTESPLDFHNLTASEELKFVRHNPTNFEGFRKFQGELDERFSKTELAREKKERRSNLVKWREMVGPRWASAALKTIENEAVEETIELVRRHQKTSLFISGESGSGKSYLAFAVLRAYIAAGWITPSQIERISEEALMGMAGNGFEGMARFNKVLAPRNRVFLIDGVGSKPFYTEKEKQLWEQLIDHIYSDSLTAIFTSNKTYEDFGAYLSDSGSSKLENLVSGREITSLSTRKGVTASKSAAATSPVELPFGKDGSLL